MEQTIMDILIQGITFDSFIKLILIFLSIVCLITIKQWASDFVSWRRFKNSSGIQEGSVIRLYSGDYIIEGRVLKANMRKVLLETNSMYIMIPMSEFKSRIWYIKKTLTSKDELLSHSMFCETCKYKISDDECIIDNYKKENKIELAE